jgi:hypothetical protein
MQFFQRTIFFIYIYILLTQKRHIAACPKTRKMSGWHGCLGLKALFFHGFAPWFAISRHYGFASCFLQVA